MLPPWPNKPGKVGAAVDAEEAVADAVPRAARMWHGRAW
jgi:hypothetical protein